MRQCNIFLINSVYFWAPFMVMLPSSTPCLPYLNHRNNHNLYCTLQRTMATNVVFICWVFVMFIPALFRRNHAQKQYLRFDHTPAHIKPPNFNQYFWHIKIKLSSIFMRCDIYTVFTFFAMKYCFRVVVVQTKQQTDYKFNIYCIYCVLLFLKSMKSKLHTLRFNLF